MVKTRLAGEETTARFSKSIVRKCLESGQAFLSGDASRDERVQLSQSVVDFRIRSVMCVPLVRPDGKAFGVIQLDTQNRGKKFTQDDLRLLWGVANQASVALENARLHEETIHQEKLRRDLELAHQVQMSFLPRALPQVPGYEFFAHYEPALEVGGDYYGFIPLADGRLGVALGDVAGKGVPAALLMAKLSSDARFSFLTEPDLARAVTKLNDLLYEFTSQADRFVTLVAAVIDPERHVITLASAGHFSPLLYRPERRQPDRRHPQKSRRRPARHHGRVRLRHVRGRAGAGRQPGAVQRRLAGHAQPGQRAVRLPRHSRGRPGGVRPGHAAQPGRTAAPGRHAPRLRPRGPGRPDAGLLRPGRVMSGDGAWFAATPQGSSYS